MRKALLPVFFSLLMSLPAWAQYDGLIISEIVHGTDTGGRPKYVEIYNATANISYSLAGLQIRTHFNGNAFDNDSLGLGRNVVLGPRETYVAAATGGWDPTWPLPDTTDSFSDNTFAINGNGNDVYELYDTNTGKTIDIYGVASEVTGRSDYSPAWAYRISRVVRREPFNNGNDGEFEFSSQEWEIDLYDDSEPTPGVHNADPFFVELPVELVSFEALADGASAQLAWTTAAEESNAGFHVEHRRASDDENTTDQDAAFSALGFVEGRGTTSEVQSYRFQTGPLEAGRHVFRLRQVDFDGAVSYSGTVELAVASAMPEGFRLGAAYPNPFNPRTQFTLEVRQAQEVRVEVFNLLGQRVRLLHEGPLEAGREHHFTFEAGDLPSGLYLFRAQGETFFSSGQVTLLK